MGRLHERWRVRGGVGIKKKYNARSARLNFFEQLDPFAAQRRLEWREPSHVSAWPRHARNVTHANGIADHYEYDRHGLRLLPECDQIRRATAHNRIRLGRNEFRRIFPYQVALTACPTVLDLDVLSFKPSEPLKAIAKRLRARVVPWRPSSQHADAPHPPELLRPHRERPCRRRAADKCDELTAPHSITSSAVASSVGGTVRPCAFAVLRFMTSSNFVGCSTGRSAGFLPLKILST